MTSGPPWPVLLTIPNFVTAGSGKALVNLAERLDRTQLTPVVGVRRRGDTPLEARLARAGIEVVELDLSPSARPYPTLPLRVWRSGRELRRRGIALVHSFDYGDTYTEALVARAAGARYVSTKKNMGWGSRAWFLRSLLSHRIAVQNEEMFRRFFHTRLLRGRCRYVPRGVVVDQFDVTDRATDRGDLRAELGIPDDAVVVASVASVQPRKNQLLLVQAVPDRPDVHLVLTGPVLDEDYAARVRAAAAERGTADRLHLVGEVDDVRPTLAAADVFALASRAEGSPVALIEAMAAGLPIVAADIPGVHELLDGTGAAALVDPDDAVATATAVGALCDDASRRAAGGRAAQDLVRSRRSIDLEVARTESLYLELLWG
jgi:glycosyltransferase involved in cell wall biosynthesis